MEGCAALEERDTYAKHIGLKILGVWQESELEPAECDRGRSKAGEEAKAILPGPREIRCSLPKTDTLWPLPVVALWRDMSDCSTQ